MFDEAQFVTEFRFVESDVIPRLSETLQLPQQLQITLKHIIIKKTFSSLPFVSHGTTFRKKPYRNL